MIELSPTKLEYLPQDLDGFKELELQRGQNGRERASHTEGTAQVKARGQEVCRSLLTHRMPLCKLDKGTLHPGACVLSLRGTAWQVSTGLDVVLYSPPGWEPFAVSNLRNHMQHPWVFKRMKNCLMLLECEAREKGTMMSGVGKISWGHLLERGEQTG